MMKGTLLMTKFFGLILAISLVLSLTLTGLGCGTASQKTATVPPPSTIPTTSTVPTTSTIPTATEELSKSPRVTITGMVISGGDTTQPGGPLDVPRTFSYQVRKSDGNMVTVQYTAYPPSPVGEAQRKKITLEFSNGAITIGDKMEASGNLNKDTSTLKVADQGDYIKTFPNSTPTAAPVQPVSEEVSWPIGETSVTATVTRPNDTGIHPAVVFVAGSGPTDRDWNSPLLPGLNGSARLLAEELAKKGFVTIRYDKRVTGPNAQKNIPLMIGKISMAGHQEELAGAVNILVARSDVNAKHIYVLGNSEGTIHALNYQLTGQPKFAGLILTGLPGRNMADVLHGQLAAQVAALPNAKEIMAGYDKLMADFLAGKPFVADPTLPEGINQLFQGFNAPVNLPFARELFLTDAAPMLAKMTSPVLVMIGKKDVQVDYQVDGQPLEKAAKGMSNITFVYPETANHVLKFESRPREALTAADALTYNASDKVLDPDAVRAILDWLAGRSR